jgi:hypothetical protein
MTAGQPRKAAARPWPQAPCTTHTHSICPRNLKKKQIKKKKKKFFQEQMHLKNKEKEK